MVTINNFTINPEGTQIDVSLETDLNETITEVYFWDNKTFQNYSLAVDLSSKLTQTSNVEVFSIVLSDVNLSSFSGLFFIEVKASNQTCVECNTTAVAGNLIQYNECLLDKILNYSVCELENCNDRILNTIINIDILLSGITISLLNGYYNEAIDLLNTLMKLCPSECSSCPTLNNYCSNSGLGFATLNNNIKLV